MKLILIAVAVCVGLATVNAECERWQWLHKGNDLEPGFAVSDMAGCVSRCRSTSGCEGATYKKSESMCWMHNSIVWDKIDWDGDFKLFIKNVCNDEEGGRTTDCVRDWNGHAGNNRIPGGAPAATLDECKAVCDRDIVCGGATYVKSIKWCWPHQFVKTDNKANADHALYSKKCDY